MVPEPHVGDEFVEAGLSGDIFWDEDGLVNLFAVDPHLVINYSLILSLPLE